MNQADRDVMIEIRTMLKESVVPRLDSHSETMKEHNKRLKVVEKVAFAASVAWGGLCVVAYVAKDAAAEWFKHKITGPTP